MIQVDLLIKNIRQLINPASDTVVRGELLNGIRVLKNVWLGASGESITFIGSDKDFEKNCRLNEDAVVIDASEYIAFPGFIDPHTHLPFAGTREDEFRLKLQGISYQEIAEKGGGIKGTVNQTRTISNDELISLCEKRLDQMLLTGSTTIEAKSGYGLDKNTELKQLEVLKAVDLFHPVEVVSTFLGAHENPDEYRNRNREYLDFLLTEVVPEVKAENLAEFTDIFCEEGYFDLLDSEYYVDKMIQEGFKIKIHADEFSSNGAAAMAARKGAVSAEHLIAITEEEIKEIANSKTACVMLPGVSFFLRLDRYAPAREIIKQNGILTLGSDFNPGSSMISSQLFIFTLGIYQMGLTIEEALNCVTINAAYAIDRHQRVGSIAVGKKMDLLLMAIPDYSYLAYHPGINPVDTVVKSGEVVVSKGRLVYKG